jgi:16S rRNA (uracil1498-N3)-methyltransferase
MSLPVHWVDSLSGVRRGEAVEVTGDEAHHAVAVRRMRAGEQVVLTDGRGRRVRGTVAETAKRRMLVTADEVEEVAEPAPELVVVQAIPKGERGELAVEVLTEVGVARIVPWAASRSVAVWRGDRAAKSLGRWRTAAREAAKQSRRAWFPEVAEQAPTTEVVRLVAEAALAVVLHEEGELSLGALEVPDHGPLVIVVGPEGGLSAEEVASLAAAGAHVVRLGSEVLRTSTAGVAAAAALLSRTERWR